jgi:hypothetical protein
MTKGAPHREGPLSVESAVESARRVRIRRFAVMTADNIASLRKSIASLLEGGNAFAAPARIVGEVPPHVRGVEVAGLGRSLWQLLEHLRIDQRDLLEYCLAEEYTELTVPDDFWPKTTAPESDEAWDAALAAFLEDLDHAKRLALDESIDLFAIVPRGTRPSQTWMRYLMLIAEHNAYHLGQFVVARKTLGAW